MSVSNGATEGPGHYTKAWPFQISLEFDLVQGALFIFALVTRLWRLDYPSAIVFDEVHFGRFASLYLKNTFHFDVHPPLGKMMVAAAAYSTGYNGQAQFEKIGSAYSSEVPVIAMRLTSALLSSFTVPVVYQIMIDLGLKRWTAVLAGVLVILDNALLVQSRFILLDAIMLFFITSSVLCYLKFKKVNSQSREIFSPSWWFWLVMLGLSNTVVLLTKYNGVFTVGLILILLVKDFWSMLPARHLSDFQIWQQAVARFLTVLCLPLVLYIGTFYIHLTILHKAGPHDDVMTSAFQASLEGGLASITKGQPLHIAYGSQITLRHTHSSRPCWLHSHSHVYPVRYRDNRGSSHQQQVTCYTYKDVNNWWIIKDPTRNTMMVDEPLRPIKNGDVVQIIHGMTSRALNSHDVAAPMSPQHQEVSCYIDYNISLPAQNLWKVEIINSEEEGNYWKTIQSQVRLLHLNTTQALKITGKQLPEWAFNQLEVATDKIVKQASSAWNVEEHRYTRSPDQDQRELDLKNSDMLPMSSTKLGFWSKFWELQLKMLSSRQDANMEHKYSSSPLEWPLMDRNIAYWFQPKTGAQIHLVGNFMIWCSGCIMVLVYVSLFVFYTLRRRRRCYDISTDEWDQFVAAGEVLTVGYFINYIPYFTTERTLFLHHYLPALLFKIMLLAFVVEHMYELLWSRAVRSVYVMLIIVWVTLVFNVFRTFSVLTYGFEDLSRDDVKKLTWRDTWEFIKVPGKQV